MHIAGYRIPVPQLIGARRFGDLGNGNGSGGCASRCTAGQHGRQERHEENACHGPSRYEFEQPSAKAAKAQLNAENSDWMSDSGRSQETRRDYGKGRRVNTKRLPRGGEFSRVIRMLCGHSDTTKQRTATRSITIVAAVMTLASALAGLARGPPSKLCGVIGLVLPDERDVLDIAVSQTNLEGRAEAKIGRHQRNRQHHHSDGNENRAQWMKMSGSDHVPRLLNSGSIIN